jgi:polyisoprenyl-phosphate glycosyltransferase
MTPRGPKQLDAFISVVAPLRDAGQYVEEMLHDIDNVMRGSFRQYEIIAVDDGSKDNTVEVVERVQQKLKNIQLYCLSRRNGVDVAIVAGLDNSIGDFVITLNPEDDPIELIPVLWEKSLQGHEVVCGIRRQGRTGGLRSRLRGAFFRLFEAATGVHLPFGMSNLRLYSRRVVSYITQNNDRHLLLKVLPFFTTYRVASVEYEGVSRGRGGFGERGLANSITNGISILLATSIRPLRFLTIMAFLASSFSLVFAIYVVAVALLKRHVVEGWISLALPMAVMFFFVSTILGLLSEYIYALAQQSGNRPVYSITKEATSSVLDIQQKLNVVGASGDFADTRSGRE